MDDSPGSNATKMERKHIEKNRRDQLKELYKQLFSLLPNDHHSLRGMTLPDQVDETTIYITNLQNELEKSKQKKQELLQNVNTIKLPGSSSSSSPVVQVLEDTGSGVDFVLINGLDNMSVFHDIIRVVHEQGYQVSSFNFQLNGNSMLQIVHQEGFEAAALCEKLKQVVNGSSSRSEVVGMESLDSWDYDIESSDILGFHILESSQGHAHP